MVIPYSKVHMFKMSLSVVLALLPMVRMAVSIIEHNNAPYNMLLNILLTVTWTVLTIVLSREFRKGRIQNWILRSIWTISFICAVVRLQLQITDDDFDPINENFIMLIPEIMFTFGLGISALFLNYIPKPLAGFAENEDDTFDASAVDHPNVPRRPSAEDRANIFSKLTFHYVTALLRLGYNRAIFESDLPDLSRGDSSFDCLESVKSRWQAEIDRNPSNASLTRVLARTNTLRFIGAGFLWFIASACQISNPLIMQRILLFIVSSQSLDAGVEMPSMLVGIGLAFAMISAALLQSFCLNMYYLYVYRVGMRIRSAVISLIYEKSFRLSTEARQKQTVGEIVNYQALDAQRLLDLVPFLNSMWSAPLQVAVTMYLLWSLVGVAMFAGLSLTLIMVFMSVFVAKKSGAVEKQLMQQKDKRSNLMNEILMGIRVIKMFAWEKSYGEKIEQIRNLELKKLAKASYLRAVTASLWASTPILVGMVTFITYALLGNTLTPSTTFPALALFVTLRFPLNMLPQVAQGLIEARTSLKRLEAFLLAPEIDPDAVDSSPQVDESPSIVVENASLSWGSNEPMLHELNFAVHRGGLTAIVGAVGTGKTSALEALLGNMTRLSGRIALRGKVAYVPQQAWIQNATVRENIIFGSEFNEQRYERTLELCELVRDIEVLSNGDQTEIGEKGINLSGGQKQRVNCARAAYSDADVFLFDDPLSALDAQVGRSVFNNLIRGALQGKTRLLVTHQIQLLDQVDEILVLRAGRIVERGPFAQLLQENGEFARLMEEYSREASHGKSDAPATQKRTAEAPITSTPSSVHQVLARVGNSDAKLIRAEERATGSVGWSVYKGYTKHMGYALVVFMLIGYAIENAARVGGDVWLSRWSQLSINERREVIIYALIYASSGGINLIFVLFRAFLLARGSLRVAKWTHDRMLWSVMRSPVSFFDTTPIGRILNRFSKDQHSVDDGVPKALLLFTLANTFMLLAIIFVIAFASPLFLIAILPLAYAYTWLQNFYMRSSREIKRLESISRSPIFALFSETLSGVATINAYGAQQRFAKINQRKLDENQRAYFNSVITNRWLSLRLECLGALVIALAALFVVLQRSYISAGVAGISIAYALQFTVTLNRLVLDRTELESQLVSVERVLQYSDLPSEAPAKIPERQPPADWPQRGEIVFDNISMRYRAGLPPVLSNLTMQIRSREKVGVVGRTGAGKSSLMAVLFRLVEAAEGRVLIDDVDISQIGLDDLRSSLSIIPQDPTLFKGTIRSNLDPFDSYSDAQLIEALEQCHMIAYVESAKGGLEAEVAEGGLNLSVGQRQLLCLGRALLRKSKILIMDEATAAIDIDTDALIQKTVRQAFRDVTVLTIAHRINTILDYDRILVLDYGRILQFDTPEELTRDENGIFASLRRHQGLE